MDTGQPASYSHDANGNPVNEPKTYGERVDLAMKTVADENLTVPVLVDAMDNAIWFTYGPAPNIAYLIGTDGKIVFKQTWFDPVQMEMEIAKYLAR
jgi:hypothetical protein